MVRLIEPNPGFLTCDDDNIGSARVMEKNGFLLSDKVENTVDGCSILTRRYLKTL